jgi:hypothetical protein
MSERDFDFFIGRWQVAHRRLKLRLANCKEWDEFGGTCITQKVLGGTGNMDDNWLDLPDGAYRAVTLRAYNLATKLWSIWWLDGRYPNRLDTPMVGRFENGTGIFFADDTFEGRPIRIRFLWTLSGYDTPRWEQAFSADAGATWETNWIMNFKRDIE